MVYGRGFCRDRLLTIIYPYVDLFESLKQFGIISLYAGSRPRAASSFLHAQERIKEGHPAVDFRDGFSFRKKGND